MSTFKITCTSADALFDGIESHLLGAARPAAQAGAEVLYQAVRTNVARIRRKTGNLASSIYQAYSQDNSAPGRAVYHVSWNARKAPHGHLVEFGHLQRYEMVRDAAGRIYPLVRPEMRGKPKPSSKAPQSVKNAYWVPLAAPVQIPAKPFVRPAIAQMPAAREAMRQRYISELKSRGVVR